MHLFEAEVFWLNNLQPVKFYPYTSMVTNHLFWEDKNELPEKLLKTFQYIKNKAIILGAKWDNKVVVEVTTPNFPHPLFFGYCDHNLVLGFGVHTEEISKKYIKRLDISDKDLASFEVNEHLEQ